MNAAWPLYKPREECAPLSVARVTLANYRNYADMRIDCGDGPVILTGANGSGKTNLMEAISLLVPGRGLRRAALADLQNRFTSLPWAVAAELRVETGDLRIGTGRDPSSEPDAERRTVVIDGEPVRGHAVLSDYIALAVVTPDMDRLLAEGASARRKFLDRLAYSFDPAHGGRVQRYEKAMRERLRLLRDGLSDAAWLSALENEMAQTAVAIAAVRRDMVAKLRTAIAQGGDVFPRADLRVRGAAEDLLDDKPALLVEDALRAALARSRGDDAQSGTCATGAHRSDLCVTHRAKSCPAELCSTGEQKALLLALILAYVRLLKDRRHLHPLFLLDDIASHLDARRRAALFDEIRALDVQAWLTGTDDDDFADLIPYAQLFHVENGAISEA